MADEPIDSKMMSRLASSEMKTLARDDAEVLQLVEEHLTIGKRAVETGTVRVSIRTETHEEIAEVTLDRAKVEVERVPINRAIDAAPPVRHEGDTMIVPVIEERLVVSKQLYLVEELHIHQSMTQETVRDPVLLRRQRAVIERTGADGELLPAGSPAGEPIT